MLVLDIFLKFHNFLDFFVFAVSDGKILGVPNIFLSVPFDNAADYLGKQRVRKIIEFQKICQGPTYTHFCE